MDTSDMKKGLKFMYEGQPYVCVDFQFVKPGKGQAFTRTRMRNMLTGNTLEKNFRSGEKFDAGSDTSCRSRARCEAFLGLASEGGIGSPGRRY